MEYRFFYPIDEHTLNTKWKTKSHLEKRTDIYFVVPAASDTSDDFHIEYGLKLRNSKRLELKIREKRLSDGQEYWYKKIRGYQRLNVDSISSILQNLRTANENKLTERLSSYQPIILCYVHKFRQQTQTAGHLTQELTGLHLQFIHSSDKSQIGGDLFFETICIETSSSQPIDKDVLEKLSQDHATITISPMGYPEFIFNQYQQIINA